MSNESLQNGPIHRRDCLKIAGVAAAGVALGVARPRPSLAAESQGLSVEAAGYRTDRVEALIDARVRIEGRDLAFETDSIGALNTHVFKGPRTREVTEIGLHPFMLAWANEGFRAYTLIPVFPLRVFRHRSIFIRTDRGIRRPEDLRGRKVATPGYSSTSLTWIRGILQHEYGVAPTEVAWYLSAKDSSAGLSGGPSDQENVLPEDLSIQRGPAGKDESEMLADGDVDALFHAAEPRAYVEGHEKIARLFPDYRATERNFYSKTGIFPIMHAVAVRRDVADGDSGLLEMILDAYSRAKKLAYERLRKTAWFQDTLPWIAQELEETRRLMGDNYWSYGLTPDNRKALEALFRYSHEQGLASRKLTVEELFHPSTLDWREPAA